MIRYDKGDHSRVALYRDTGSRRRWEFVGNELFPGPMIGGKIEAPGAFALLADHDPPVIRNVTPGRGESTRNKRPTIRFEMFDILSGIGSDADVTLTIEGEAVVSDKGFQFAGRYLYINDEIQYLTPYVTFPGSLISMERVER